MGEGNLYTEVKYKVGICTYCNKEIFVHEELAANMMQRCRLIAAAKFDMAVFGEAITLPVITQSTTKDHICTLLLQAKLTDDNMWIYKL